MEAAAVVILSGGQDSTTCLFWAKQNYHKVVALSFNYGQRHAIELQSAAKIGKIAQVEHHVIEVPGILRSTSPLVSDSQLEKYTNYESMDKIIGDRIELTFVPMRNAFFLTVAANFALSQGIRILVTGVCQQDNANYPDCRLDFIRAQEKTINLALGIADFKIVAPLMDLTKAETVKAALDLPGCYSALAYSHTSYDGKYPPTDMNHANVLRAQGFLEAGIPDPLILRAYKEGVMELPSGSNYTGEKIIEFGKLLEVA